MDLLESPDENFKENAKQINEKLRFNNTGVDIILPPIPINVDKKPIKKDAIDIKKLLLLVHKIFGEFCLSIFNLILKHPENKHTIIDVFTYSNKPNINPIEYKLN